MDNGPIETAFPLRENINTPQEIKRIRQAGRQAD
jgi:hypothetical protein